MILLEKSYSQQPHSGSTDYLFFNKLKGRLSMLAVIGLCLLSMETTATRIYRWVDDRGTVHYSDIPKGNAEEIDIRRPPHWSDRETRRRQKKNRQWFKQRQKERQSRTDAQKAVRAKRAEQRQKALRRQQAQCQRLRRRYEDKVQALSDRKRSGTGLKPRVESQLKGKLRQMKDQLERSCG